MLIEHWPGGKPELVLDFSIESLSSAFCNYERSVVDVEVACLGRLIGNFDLVNSSQRRHQTDAYS